jgi:hypothetical protein
MKRTKIEVLRLALHYAILYEQTYIEAIQHCPDAVDSLAASKQNIADFKKWLRKLKP